MNLSEDLARRADAGNPVKIGLIGAGEMGTIAATPAIANAVMDAIAHLGVEHIELPLTPQRIWKAINKI